MRLLLDVSESTYFNKGTNEIMSFWSNSQDKAKKVAKALNSFNIKLEKDIANLYSEKEIHAIVLDSSKDFQSNPIMKAEMLKLSKKVDKNILNEYGHVDNPEIALSNLGGYIKIALRKSDKPMHFKEVAKEVTKLKGKKVNVGTCHNELVKGEDFALIGRGIYGLKSGGHKDGTVQDRIVDILKKGPLSREQIMKEILKEALVKEQTVAQSLSNKAKFKRLPNGKYQLAI